LDEAELLVIGNKASEFREISGKVRPDQVVIDLVRLFENDANIDGSYQGICW
jgi:GDP-mannose 6-dehydrogenase